MPLIAELPPSPRPPVGSHALMSFALKDFTAPETGDGLTMVGQDAPVQVRLRRGPEVPVEQGARQHRRGRVLVRAHDLRRRAGLQDQPGLVRGLGQPVGDDEARRAACPAPRRSVTCHKERGPAPRASDDHKVVDVLHFIASVGAPGRRGLYAEQSPYQRQ